MVFYIVIMGKIDLSISWMQIGQDLRKTEGPLRVIVCLLEGIYVKPRKNQIFSIVLIKTITSTMLGFSLV